MSEYIKFYDESPRWLRVVLSAVGVPAFLYRLFGVIMDKANDGSKLLYLILNVMPIIGTFIWILDIIWCALGRHLPTCFGDLAEEKKDVVEAEVVEEEKEDE